MDTADVWGACEATIGEFIESTRFGDGGRTVVLTRYTPEVRYRLSKDDVRAAVRRACKRLGLERLDLVQLVWRDFRVRHYVQTARHLSELVAEGLVSGFGVCDFDVARLQELERAGIAVDTVQVQFSLLDRRPERAVERNGGGSVESMLAYCKARGIAVLARGVLAVHLSQGSGSLI